MRSSLRALAFLVTVVAAALEPAASEVRMEDIHGRLTRVLAADGRKATVLFFLLPDCPVANLYAPEISRVVEEYAPRGVRSFAVYADPDLAAAAAQRHAREYRLACPALCDPGHLLVRLAGATVSPEAVVFDATGMVIYRGRIDDRAVRAGVRKTEPEVRDLRHALDDLLEGRLTAPRFAPAVGCHLPVRR